MTVPLCSLSHALEIFQENKMCDKDTMKLEKHTDAPKVCFFLLFLHLQVTEKELVLFLRDSAI